MPAVGARQIEELDVEECMRLLALQQHGRIAFLHEGAPDILPVNYCFHEGAVVFRVGRGRLLDLIDHSEAVFEIDSVKADRSGWSVIVRGKAIEAADPADLEELRSLPLQPWAKGERDHYIRILPKAITGRRLV